jgi:hypothetical protein
LQSVLKQSNRGTINWNLVACDVPGRSQTKCYHRYIHLTRKKMKTEFEPTDDQLLIEQHQLKNGNLSSESLDHQIFRTRFHMSNLLAFRHA